MQWKKIQKNPWRLLGLLQILRQRHPELFQGESSRLLKEVTDRCLLNRNMAPHDREFLHAALDRHWRLIESLGDIPVVCQGNFAMANGDDLPGVGYDGTEVTIPARKDLDPLLSAVPGVKWNGKANEWFTAPSVQIVAFLRKHGVKIPDDLELWDRTMREYTDTPAVVHSELKGIKGTLRKFQKEGVDFLETKKGRALIADAPGLGKTLQAIAWLMQHPNLRPAIVVCPASLKLNWEAEFHKWAEKADCTILKGTKPYNFPGRDIIILNYDILSDWEAPLLYLNPKVIVFDESHALRERKTIRTKTSIRISRSIPCCICLTGTPILNRPIEMFNVLNMLAPTVFTSYWRYAREYCNARPGPFGWDVNGASNTERLHSILKSTVMIRRLKKDVLKELPPKTHAFVPMDLSNWDEYRTAQSDLIEWMKKFTDKELRNRKAEALVKLGYLRRIAAQGKMPQVIDWIDEFTKSGEKLVVFTVHRSVINGIMEHFSEHFAVKVDGSVSTEQRNEAVNRFQNDRKTRLFVGNAKAAGEGLTLTAASNVAFVELPWTPGEVAQCGDRCHRMTQENPVTCWYLMVPGTIEERMMEILQVKQEIVDRVMDGAPTDMTSTANRLLEEMRAGK